MLQITSANKAIKLRKHKGFTLIEVAIVLVIVGLLLGGVLKGQELINAARVRSYASQLDGIKIAYLGFFDRYRAMPGDLPTAIANAQIIGSPGGCTGGTGCNNGKIDDDEIYVVWAQISHSGFIQPPYNGTITDTTPTPANNPNNPFGGYLHLMTDSRYDDLLDPAQPPLLNIKSGSQMTGAVLGEIDRKIDDGLPLTGVFRSYGHTATTAYDGVTDCTIAGTPVQWNGGSPVNTCGGTAIQ